MPLGPDVGLGSGDFVFDGAQAPRKKGTAPTNFWPMSIVAKRQDGSNFGPGDVVLDGVAAPPKGAQPSAFGSCLLRPNGWVNEDATLYGI